MLSVSIATVAIGLGTAGLILALPRLTGRRLARWVAPLAGGLAMTAFTLWADYSWYGRTAAALPEGSVVATRSESGTPLRPWTLLVPRITGFLAVGPTTTIRGTDLDLSIARVVRVDRFGMPESALQLFDCAGGRRAALDEPPEGEALRLPETPDWVPSLPGDPLIAAACRRG